jgi:3-oxoacyl-[acyl-carrier-protein] synthase II
MLRLGRARALLVGGVEELCIQTFLGFYKLGFLVTASNGTLPPYRPLGEQPSGALLGEGSAFLMLELLEDAQARKAAILGEVISFASLFHPDSMYRYDEHATGAISAMRDALHEAALEPKDIDLVSASANATKSGDAASRFAFDALFGTKPPERITPKGLLGEAFSASGALASAWVLGLGNRHRRHPGGPRVLVEGTGPTGISAAVMFRLGKPDEN